jgi:hypothetical protein
MRWMRMVIFAALLVLSGCGESAAERAVREAVGDPGARFQSLRNVDGFTCGEVNSPKRPGGYARFVFDERAGAVLVDPGNAATGVARPAQDPACSKPPAYQSVEERLSCAAAPVLEAEAEAKRAFEAAWQKACG